MKNRKLVFLLLPLNFILWGYIGIAIYKSVKIDPIQSGSFQFEKTKPFISATTDTFNLLLDYRDPLGRGIGHKATIKQVNNIFQG